MKIHENIGKQALLLSDTTIQLETPSRMKNNFFFSGSYNEPNQNCSSFITKWNDRVMKVDNLQMTHNQFSNISIKQLTYHTIVHMKWRVHR
jgi:hypothetical protein